MSSKTNRQLIEDAGGAKGPGVNSRAIYVSLPIDLRGRLTNFPSVNWPGVARKAFVDLLDLLEADSETKET